MWKYTYWIGMTPTLHGEDYVQSNDRVLITCTMYNVPYIYIVHCVQYMYNVHVHTMYICIVYSTCIYVQCTYMYSTCTIIVL